MGGEITLRMAEPSDVDALLAIYTPYVEKTAITFDWEVPGAAEFAAKMEKTRKRYPYLAALRGEELVGYAYATPFKDRAAYDWSVESTIYLKEGSHGQGTGTLLYTALEELLRRQNIKNINACILYPHPQSITFHERLGYKTVAHFQKCGYKLGAWHDMIWMEKLLGAHDGAPEPVIPITELPEAEVALILRKRSIR